MKRILALSAGLSLLSGCWIGSTPIEGIWVFYVTPAGDVTTDSSCSENFNDLNCPSTDGGGGENPWTYTSDSEQDTDAFVAQIVGGSTNTALLFAYGEVWQGEKNDNGDWVFTFDNFEDGSSTETHESGYSYSRSSFEGQRLRLVLTRDGSTFSGDLVSQVTVEYSWTEGDLWDEDAVGRYSGRIPSDSYLVDGDGFGRENDPEESDCSDANCTLEIFGDYAASYPVTGELTDVKDASDFDALESYGDFRWDFDIDTGF